jgi:uncharacterized membrane protein
VRIAFVGVLLVLAATTAAARLPSALGDPLWLDEVASARVIAQPSLPDVLGQVRRTESTPPLWYVLNWTIRKATGSSLSITRLRLLSVLFACALTIMTVVFARRFLPLGWAAFAGLVVALAPDLVAHGAELRAYTLFALLSVCFAYLLMGCVERPTRVHLTSLAAIVAAGCLTHYFFLLTLAGGLTWLLQQRRRQASLPTAVAIGIGILPFLGWVPAFDAQYRHKLYAFTGPFDIRDVVYLFARLFGLFTARGAVDAAGRVLVATIAVAGVVAATRRGNALPVLLTVVPVTVGTAIWALGPRVFITRNFLGVAPFAAICFASLLACLPRRVGISLGVVSTVAVAVFYLQFQLDWGRAAYDRIAGALVAEGWHRDDPVLQFGPAPQGLMAPVSWYLPGQPHDHACRPATRPADFVVSYDESTGPAWLRRHAAQIVVERTFAAFDHSPRGPRSRQLIVVARLEPPAPRAHRRPGRAYCFSSG